VKTKGLFAVAIAIAGGILVLAGYFIPITVLRFVRSVLLDWAVILAAFAVLVGVFNLLLVHFDKVRRKQKGMAYSAILIVFLVATFLFGLVLKPEHPYMVAAFTAVQLPVEASLMALLAVTLTYASIRLLRRRLNLFSIIFLICALLTLLGTAPIPFLGQFPGLSNWLRPVLSQVLAAAGARGILLGVALGTLTTGLRVLFGADRPYGGKNG
jgi:hypothetical protein